MSDTECEVKMEWNERLRLNRDAAVAEIKRLGFTPAEEWNEYFREHGNTHDLQTLQGAWRELGCRRDPKEILWAVIDALTQEGIPAGPGDATSIVEQIVRVQYDRAESALRLIAFMEDRDGLHPECEAWNSGYEAGVMLEAMRRDDPVAYAEVSKPGDQMIRDVLAKFKQKARRLP